MERLAVLFYDYVDDIVERRKPFREEHLGLLHELKDEGVLVMAGALGDPVHGAAIVFRFAHDAEDFVKRDPYVREGLVTAHRVEPWAIAI